MSTKRLRDDDYHMLCQEQIARYRNLLKEYFNEAIIVEKILDYMIFDIYLDLVVIRDEGDLDLLLNLGPRFNVKVNIGISYNDYPFQRNLKWLRHFNPTLSLKRYEIRNQVRSLPRGFGLVTYTKSKNKQKVDITSLANFTMLKELWLYGIQIVNIAPLKTLNLTKLYLYDNQICDITTLANLTKLTDLDLHKNQIEDITPLKGLINLTLLKLNDNQIKDVTALKDLTELENLFLNINKIKDITPLTNLTKLNYLGLHGNQIEDITPLTNLTELQGLTLNGVVDITPLKNTTKLENLYLNGKKIKDIEK